MKHAPGVSVIVLTLNGGPLFKESLEGILDRSYPGPVQLVVIDSGSTDGTREAARKAGAEVVEIPRKSFHHAGTRNRAMAWARHDRVLFMVQDAVPVSRTWLSDLVEALEQGEGVAAVYTGQSTHEEADLYGRFETEMIAKARGARPRIQEPLSEEELAGLPYEEAYRRIGLDNVCALYRKSILERIPFPHLPFAEDLAWAKEALLSGYRILYEPRILVKHSHRRTPEERFRRQILNSVWVARILGRVAWDLGELAPGDLLGLAGRFGRCWEGEWGWGGTVAREGGTSLKRPPLQVVRWALWGRFVGLGRGVAASGLLRDAQKAVEQHLALVRAAHEEEFLEQYDSVLDQASAEVLGKIFGEAYAGACLRGNAGLRMRMLMRPFLGSF